MGRTDRLILLGCTSYLPFMHARHCYYYYFFLISQKEELKKKKSRTKVGAFLYSR